VRPQLGENIGMAARAMRNFGLRDLRIVAPRDGWSEGSTAMQAAADAAAGADGIIRAARVFEDVAGAIADLHCVYATTARERGQSKPVLTPAAAMPAIIAANAAGQRAGILFGAERTGLGNGDVSLADAIISFPVDAGFASLNLAQAVLLVAYEWRRQAVDPTAPVRSPEPGRPAQRASLAALLAYVEAELAAAGFYKPPEKAEDMKINFRNILHRRGLEEQDVRTLMGVFRALRGRRQAR
jgi:tRNA/rRNA methyltransferase